MVSFPVFKLTANGDDVTEHIRDNLISLTFSDTEGYLSDQLSIKVAGIFARPLLGGTLTLALGIRGGEMHDYGVFKVNLTEVDYKSMTTTAKATAVNFKESAKERKEKLWEAQSLADIAAAIAADNGLKAGADAAGGVMLKSVTQKDKNDLEFICELADEYGFICTVKDETIILLSKNTGKRDALEVKVNMNECQSLNISRSAKTQYESVKVVWQDLDTAKMQEATAGSGEPVYIMQDKRPKSPEEGAHIAESMLNELRAQSSRGSLSFNGGRKIRAGAKLVLTGTGNDDDCTYHINEVTHTMSTSEYTVNVEFAEIKEAK